MQIIDVIKKLPDRVTRREFKVSQSGAVVMEASSYHNVSCACETSTHAPMQVRFHHNCNTLTIWHITALVSVPDLHATLQACIRPAASIYYLCTFHMCLYVGCAGHVTPADAFT
jgi:hypothetical protein